jgi:hypothetical protein
MRTLNDSLFWMFNSGRFGRRRRPFRPMRPVRPFNPIRSLFRLFWSVAWILIGLGIAFSPELRGLFVRFWVGFAQVAAALARGLAGMFQ